MGGRKNIFAKCRRRLNKLFELLMYVKRAAVDNSIQIVKNFHNFSLTFSHNLLISFLVFVF